MMTKERLEDIESHSFRVHEASMVGELVREVRRLQAEVELLRSKLSAAVQAVIDLEAKR